MTHKPYGYVPTDAEIARLGLKAFGPLREPFVPSAEDFARAARDLTPGDDGEEFAAVADALDICHLADEDVLAFWIV